MLTNLCLFHCTNIKSSGLTLEASLKRSRDELMVDQTDQICNQLLQPFETIPSKARELSTLIKADLLCKLPVAGDEEIKFPILKDFIYTSEEDRRNDIAIQISYALSDHIWT